MKKEFILISLSALLFAWSCQKAEFPMIDALDASTWNSSEWISAADAPVVTKKIKDGDRAADGASWFYTTWQNEKKVTTAKWMTSGLGIYELYVNGIRIGDEILKPGFTHYEKTKISYTYDVTDAFKTGKNATNTLSAQVTPGWWGDKIVTPKNHEGMIGKKCAFRAVLELTYEDGTKEYLGTNCEDWLAGIAGPVTHAAIFDGEEYDARIPLGFETPEKLSKPEINTEFSGEIVPSNGAEIYFREDLTLKPIQAYVYDSIEGASEEGHGKVVIKKEYKASDKMRIRPGETLVIDFGQNCSAVPDFVFKAQEGTVLTCLPAELLNDGNGAYSRGMDGPEGSIHRLNLRTPQNNMLLRYTFGDACGYVNYRPRYTFYGYRYIAITATDEVVFKSIQSIPVTSITKEMEIGTLETGNELINKLISNTLWGQRSNYLSVSTDCPQRNERLGWTADTQVFTETGAFFANTQTFFHKWMKDLRDSQSPLGAYPSVAPTAQYGDGLMRLGWADAGIIVPWVIWKQFNDVKIINECWDSMEKFIAHIYETNYDHNAHIKENGNKQYADWLSYEPLETSSKKYLKNKETKVFYPETIDYWNFLSASYLAMDAQMMADMAVATGRDAKLHLQKAADTKAFIRKKFFTKEGKFKTDILNTMQTPALFALKNNILEGEAKDQMIARLRENFKAHDNCLQTGFLGTSILMSVLTDNGMNDIAYDLLFQRKNPSWLYSVDNGATTIWERWNSYMIEYGMGPKGMNSFNHYAYGCVCEWIWETAAGIAADAKAPGFKNIIMSPIPDKRLGYIKASYQSVSGVIKSEWHYEGDEWIWNFTIPEGCTATVTLPGSNESSCYTAGSYTLSMTL